MNITYFEQNLPQEFLCEICAQVCKFAKKNLETGFIYCHECCYEYDTDITDLFSLSIELIYYKCQDCFKYKKYHKYRVHQQKCQHYYQNELKGMERFEVLGLTPQITLNVQILIDQQLNYKFDQQLLVEKTDQNYKIICRSTFCQKQLDLSEVRLHFKNCEFQQKSCHFCEHWSGTKGDYQIHKQMCYQDCDKFDQQINRLNLELKTQEIQKRILQKKQIQIQNKLVTLMQWNEENK